MWNLGEMGRIAGFIRIDAHYPGLHVCWVQSKAIQPDAVVVMGSLVANLVYFPLFLSAWIEMKWWGADRLI